MTDKQKANELIEKYGKDVAIIVAGEIVYVLNHSIRDLEVRGNTLLNLIDYWRRVIKWLRKLSNTPS